LIHACRRLKQLLIAISLTCLFSTLSAYNLPQLGNATNAAYTPVQEESIGKIFIQQILSQIPLNRDPVVDSYIRQLGSRLIKNSPAKYQTFRFFVVNDDSINAFAVPGAYIAVNAGLIMAAKNRCELAAVMAHEVAHIAQHHFSRMVKTQEGRKYLNIVAVIAAVALGATGHGGAGIGAASAAGAGNLQANINQTRTFEKEADRVGIKILVKSGFNPHCMPAFFKRLEDANKLNQNKLIPEILRSHPLTVNRLSEAENLANRYQKKTDTRTDPLFPFIQARLKVDTDANPIARFNQLTKMIQRRPPTPVLRYEYALEALGLNKFKLAEKTLRALQTTLPDNWLIPYSLAGAYLANNKTTDALKLLKQLHADHPNQYAITVQYARTLLRNKEAKVALTLLEPFQTRYKLDSIYLQLLSKSYGKSNLLYKAFTTRARLFALNGLYAQAITQLQIAIKHTKNTFEQGEIRRQITQYENALKEQASF
jgi:beta-barrel assembly-enhancing protease